MMRNFTGVMKDSLHRAEAYYVSPQTFFPFRLLIILLLIYSRYVGRLQTVGIQRDAQDVYKKEE